MTISEARYARHQFLRNRIRELYNAGKKPLEIAKKISVTEERVNHYLRILHLAN